MVLRLCEESGYVGREASVFVIANVLPTRHEFLLGIPYEGACGEKRIQYYELGDYSSEIQHYRSPTEEYNSLHSYRNAIALTTLLWL